MAQEFEVGVKLTADGKSLVGETQAAKQALGGLGDSARKTGAELGQTTRQSDALEASAARLKTGLIAAAGAYLSLGAAIGGAKAIMDAAIANDRLVNSLTVGVGGIKAAREEITFLTQESNRLGLQFSGTAEQYTKLAAASKGTRLEGQATRDIFLSVAKASTVLGLSAADTGGVLTAVQQIISKNKVSTEELLQIAERVPGTFATVARALNVTGAELSSMLQKGELMAEDLLPALAAEWEKTYGAQSLAAAQGLNAQINRLDNAMGDLKLAIAETGLIDFLSSGIQLATRLTNAMTGVFASDKNLSALEFQEKKVASLTKKVEDMRAAWEKPGFHRLFNNDDPLTQAENELAMATKWLNRLKDSADDVTDAKGVLTEGNRKLTDEQTKFIEKINEEYGQLGKSSAEILKMQAAKLGVLDVTGSLIDKIGQEKTALEESKKSAAERVAEEKKSSEIYAELINRIQEKTGINKLEIELGRSLNEIEKLSLEINEKIVSGELRLTEAKKQKVQAELQELSTSQQLLKNQKFVQEASAKFVQSGYQRVANIKDEVKALREQNAMIGMTAEQIKAHVTAKTLEEAQVIRNAAAYAGPLHDAYIQYADDLVEIADYQKALIEERQIAQYAQDFNNAFSQIEQTGRQAFVQFAAHGKGAMESIGEAIKTSIIDLLYQLTVRKWIINIGTSISGSLFGTGAMASGNASGVGIMDMASLGSNIVSLGSSAFSTGLGATGLVGGGIAGLGGLVGSGSMSAFGAGLAGDAIAGVAAGVEAGMSGAAAASAASMGSTIGAVAGPMIALAAVDMLGRFLAGNKSTGTFVDSVPVIGGFAAALFGRGPLKQKETNLIGDITAEGFSGITSTKFKAQGGWARSDKIDRVMTDTDSGQRLDRYGELVEGGISKVLEPFAEQAKAYALELGKYLDESIGNISKSARGMADTLGIGSDALDSFSMSINIASEKGKALTDEQIGQVIADAGEQMARHLIPEIDSLSKTGETAFQTLQRLSGEFNVLVGLGTALGNTVSGTKAFLQGVAFEDRSAFIQQAGGADMLSQNIGFFSQNFLTEAERLAPITETVTEKMAELGLQGIKTKDQFRELVQSQDLTTESGRKMFLELMNIQGSFLIVANAAEAAETAVDSLIPKLDVTGLLNDAFSSLQRSVDAERKKITKTYNDDLKSTQTAINEVSGSINKLKSLAEGLKSTVASIRGLTVSEAQQQIAAAIASARKGIFPDLGQIQPALQALQGQSTFGFKTREEFERSRAANANLVAELGNLTDDQLDSQEKMLSALERSRDLLQTGFDNEMARLDGILESARREVDALTGLNTVLLSLADALNNFSIARDAAVDSGGTTTHPAMVLGGTGNSSISSADIRNFIGSGKTPDEILQAALQYGVSAQQVVAAMGGSAGFTLDNIRRFAASRGITGFASGGVHPGGVRIVGELGPELEMTGPSRIYSNQQTRDLLGSSEIVAAIKELATAVHDGTGYSKKTADLLMRVTRDGESLRTVAA